MGILLLCIKIEDIIYSEQNTLIIKELASSVDDLVDCFNETSISDDSKIINQEGYVVLDIKNDIYNNIVLYIANSYDSVMKCLLIKGDIRMIRCPMQVKFKEYMQIEEGKYHISIEVN